MLTKRNVPGWERALRIGAGAALLLVGLLALKATPLGLALAAGGVVALGTGLAGFCPMCALLGRCPVGAGRTGDGK